MQHFSCFVIYGLLTSFSLSTFADGSTYHTLTVFTSSDLGLYEQQCTTKSSLATLNMSRNSGKPTIRKLGRVLGERFVMGFICTPFLWCDFWCMCVHRYAQGHIWACPPSEGDDYIFHCHPIDQKIPKPKRLQEWYRKMLDKAFAERILHDYKVKGNVLSHIHTQGFLHISGCMV